MKTETEESKKTLEKQKKQGGKEKWIKSQILTGKKETARYLKYEEQNISLSKINKNCKLVPRYRCSALIDLCQMDVFAPDAVSYLKGLSFRNDGNPCY